MTRARTLFLCSLLAGCTSASELDVLTFEEFIQEKEDTGYVGSRAAELEATFTARVRVQIEGKTAAELEAIATSLRADPQSYEHRELLLQVTDQIKYARNALKEQNIDLNLEGGAPELSEVTVVEGGLELAYTVRLESLVKFKDLEREGRTPADLVGRVVMPRVPLAPSGLFERTGNACTTDPDTHRPVEMSELGAHNLFYYFNPAQEGCPLGEADLVTATYTIESSLDAPTVFPEYDRLVADGRITMTALFGQITHGELKTSDWGFIAYNSFARELQRLGFRVVERYPENRGQRLEKTYQGGLVVSIDMQTPVSYADNVPRDQSNERFREAIRGNEIVYYNGHAFYGSLTVLDDRSVYPADVYQIIFMDACWSYAYYTKQIFRNRSTDADPDGYALVDVVNNTEPGITGSETTAAILYDNIFRGAAAVHAGTDSTRFSWNNLVQYMNEHAEARARRRTQYPDPEIYGASGVRDNRYDPRGGGPVDPPPTMERKYENTTSMAIPDDNDAGVTSTVAVPADAGAAARVRLQVQIEHTYVGDLQVRVSHGGRELVLHNMTGGSMDNLTLDVTTEMFSGTQAGGDWVLRVADTAGSDTGSLVRWSVTLL